MNSILRFLIFVAVLALAISVLYFWRAYTLITPPNEGGSVAASSATPGAAAGGTPVQPSASPTPASAQAPAAPVAGTLQTLAQLDRDFQTLVQRVRPAVVSITAENERRVNTMQPGVFGMMRLPPNLGSGVIVSRDGFIVTNLHVIRNARSIQVHLYDGRTFPAAVVGADPLTDIALIRIDAQELDALPFGNSDLVRPGQIVFAVGNPYGLQETVTQGIISGIGRRSTSETVNEFFQTDTAINPGNSGGPLLNLQGEIIGINNAIHTQTGGWQGISFSIPSNTVRRVFEDLQKHGRVLRSWFGVVWGRPLTPQLASQLGLPDAQGVLIQQVVPDSPAEAAGIEAGDVILTFNNRKIADGIDLRNRVAEMEIGQDVPITLIRNGREISISVRLGKFPGS